MPSNMEFEEKNVERAVEKACKKLKIPAEKLKYEVLSYGSSGIFGLVGSRKAKIRVCMSESQTKSKSSDAGVKTDKAPKGNSKKKAGSAPSTAPETKAAEEKQELSENTINLAREALGRMIASITTDAEITVQKQENNVIFQVTGGNAAILIGKQGQTLEAIQYLIKKIVSKHNGGSGYVEVDVENYLRNRIESLQKHAEKCAEKAVRNSKPVTVGQMNARDRRIVHMALKADNKVKTQSIGSGHLRRLVVYPRKQSSSNASQ